MCDLLKAHNAYVLKADDIVHDLLSQDAITIQQVKEEFGESVIQNGKVDRKTLATRVFTRPDQLNKLEQILHPKVVQTIKNAYTSTDKLFVVEIPLLFEIGFDTWFDEILFVTANKELSKKRFIAKGFTEEQFEKRLKRFLPNRESKNITLIENNGSLEELKQQVDRWIKKTNKRDL